MQSPAPAEEPTQAPAYAGFPAGKQFSRKGSEGTGRHQPQTFYDPVKCAPMKTLEFVHEGGT